MLEKILSRGYLKEGEKDWNDIAMRVSNFCGGKEMYHAMIEKKLIPASPTLINAGTKTPSLSSCFVLGVEDTIESIFEVYAQSSKVFKSSGGVGINWSKLRAKGSPLSGGGETSGVVSFLSIFNEIIETVKQGGVKKGAAMCCLNIEHPEIEDFIRMKLQEQKFKNFNISPVVTDEFMRKAIRGDKRANQLFDLIVDCTWNCSEPGMIFIDTINKDNTVPGLGLLECVNPCLHEDSYMFTENGLERIAECKSKIWNGDSYSNSTTWSNGNKNVVRITSNSGYEWIVTPDHKFMLNDGSWCEAQELMDKRIRFELTEHDWIGKNPYPDCNYEILGFEFGDGNYHKASGRMKYIYFTPEKDQEVIDIVSKEFNDVPEFDSTGKKYTINIPYGGIYASAFVGILPERMIPDWIMTLPKEQMRLFLRGLFSANGTNLEKYHKIQLVSSNKEMLQQVQQMLLLFGIKGKLWWHNRENVQTFYNGDYTCKQSWHIVISRKSYVKYLNTIGFIQSYKKGYEILYNYKNEAEYETICNIEECNTANVWDFKEPINHYGICSGAYVHNCAEEPLRPNESCNLCGLNLLPFVKGNEINWKDLESTVRIGIRFLDKCIDKNMYPLPEIEKATKETRKLGLYPLGVADILIEANLGYNTKEGRSFLENIWEFINQVAWDESVKLGKRYGPFPAHEHSNTNLIPIGARNAAVTCAAPAGTTSFIAGSNFGIEPFTSFVSIRRNGAGEGKIVIPQFEQMLDKMYPEYKHEAIDHCGKTGTIQDLDYISSDVKKVFVSAYTIHWKDHIDMMAMFQKHCRGGALSKTVNLPASITREDIKEAYIYAWKKGCKGITFYREGTRDAVYNLEKTVTKKTGPDYQVPKKAPAIRYNVNVGCGRMSVIIVGDPESFEPIEVWMIPISGGGCAGHCSGEGRTISNALQFGVPPQKFASSLSKVVCKACANKDKLDGKSCPDAAGKRLLEFIRDAPELFNHIKHELNTVLPESSVNVCPDCKTPMIYTDGCRSCPNPACGYSKCN